jgi:hypothetical protein
MKIRSRTSFVVLFLIVGVGLAIPICRRISRSLDANRALAIQHKSAHHSPGTILSVTKLPWDRDSHEESDRVRICFSIDSFAELSSEDRGEYEPAERARQAGNVPSCRDSNVELSEVPLKPGDHLDVYFLLENEGQIDVVRVSTQGRDL